MWAKRLKIFQAYKHKILLVYEDNKNQKLNMSAVYDFLEEKYGNLPGSEKSLRNYIHILEQTGELKYEQQSRFYSKVPELAYGKQMQLDFGEYKTDDKRKIYIFGAVLSASRFKYIALQENPFKTMDVIFHLLDCFDYFQGIPEELVIDQDSLMVVDENHGDIVYTRKFKIFLEEMELKMYVCRKADPESKGKIENVIKYVKYNFLQVRTFETIQSAKESLRKWLSRRANGKICQATGRMPAIAIEEERHYLRPVRNSIFRKDGFVGREQRIVSEKSFIMVGSNEYSVPVEYRKRIVEFYIAGDELFVFDCKNGREIAQHHLSMGTSSQIRNSDHFRCKSRPLKELETETRKLFNFSAWEGFLEKVHQALPRYFRDQCVLAKKLFVKIHDDGLFEMAIQYCLENKSYSMNALNDTYKHLKKEHEQNQKMIQQAFGSVFGIRPIEEPMVCKRTVQDYETTVSQVSKRRGKR